MAINLTQFNFQEDLTSQTFNQKLTEIQTHLNNLSSANERLIRENQELRQLLNNKVEKSDLMIYDSQNNPPSFYIFKNFTIELVKTSVNNFPNPESFWSFIITICPIKSTDAGVQQIGVANSKIAIRYATSTSTWSNWFEK